MLCFEVDLIWTRCADPQSPESTRLTFEVDVA